jgi:hypothetical protein
LNKVLVDTSFLISFADPARTHHAAAHEYFRTCLSHDWQIHLSTIAVAEFQVRQPINDLPLRNFWMLPFNVEHAMSCALLWHALARDPVDDRVRFKDDLKLIAQCDVEGITHVLTEDANTLTKYVERLSASGRIQTRCILLNVGFDASWFSDGQRSLPGVAPLR